MPTGPDPRPPREKVLKSSAKLSASILEIVEDGHRWKVLCPETGEYVTYEPFHLWHVAVGVVCIVDKDYGRHEIGQDKPKTWKALARLKNNIVCCYAGAQVFTIVSPENVLEVSL